MAPDKMRPGGRLQDLDRLKLDPQQLLSVLGGDDGLRSVQDETGMSREEVGAEVLQFVRYVTSAWNMVQVDRTQEVPRLGAAMGGVTVECW